MKPWRLLNLHGNTAGPQLIYRPGLQCPFPPICFLAIQLPDCAGAWGYFSLGARLGIFNCWTSQDSFWPISPAEPLRSLWMTTHPSGAPATPHFASHENLLKVHFVQESRALMLYRVIQFWAQYWLLKCTVSNWPSAGLCATDCYPLHPAILPISVHFTAHLATLYFINPSRKMRQC